MAATLRTKPWPLGIGLSLLCELPGGLQVGPKGIVLGGYVPGPERWLHGCCLGHGVLTSVSSFLPFEELGQNIGR